MKFFGVTNVEFHLLVEYVGIVEDNSKKKCRNVFARFLKKRSGF